MLAVLDRDLESNRAPISRRVIDRGKSRVNQTYSPKNRSCAIFRSARPGLCLRRFMCTRRRRPLKKSWKRSG